MSLVKFDVLQDYISSFANVDEILPKLSTKQLYKLYAELKDAQANATMWFNILQSNRRKILPKNKELIIAAYRNLEQAHKAVHHEVVLVEIAEEEEEEEGWEHELQPYEQGSKTEYDYGLLAPYEIDDFDNEMDETWYPTPIRGSM